MQFNSAKSNIKKLFSHGKCAELHFLSCTSCPVLKIIFRIITMMEKSIYNMLNVAKLNVFTISGSLHSQNIFKILVNVDSPQSLLSINKYKICYY